MLKPFLLTKDLSVRLSKCVYCNKTLMRSDGNHLFYFDTEACGFICRKCKPMRPEHKGRGIPIWENAMADAKSTTLRNAWTIDIEKWFGLRTPTNEQKVKLDNLRDDFKNMADSIMVRCPSNPDRTHAVRQLKESMQTAIASIVCADTWGDLEAPETPESEAS